MNLLYSVARHSILEGLEKGQPLNVKIESYPDELQELGASFVTLHQGGELRGCAGSLEFFRPSVKDVAHSAFAAAFRDGRFMPLEAEEFKNLKIHVSVLSSPELLEVASEEELLRILCPGTDGLIIQDGEQRATFLPSVWESLPTPELFLEQLKAKAGLSQTHWSDTFKVHRYTVKGIP